MWTVSVIQVYATYTDGWQIKGKSNIKCLNKALSPHEPWIDSCLIESKAHDLHFFQSHQTIQWLLVPCEWGWSHHRRDHAHYDRNVSFYIKGDQSEELFEAQVNPNHAKKINICPLLVFPLISQLLIVCWLWKLHQTFSLKMGFPESSVRCMNSRCNVPNSARMLLPADAHPQFQLVPL